jgi:hypothetical protein
MQVTSSLTMRKTPSLLVAMGPSWGGEALEALEPVEGPDVGDVGGAGEGRTAGGRAGHAELPISINNAPNTQPSGQPCPDG